MFIKFQRDCRCVFEFRHNNLNSKLGWGVFEILKLTITNYCILNFCFQGECGILFTSKKESEVLEVFESFCELDYARSGARSIHAVELKEGPLEQFAHSLEPHLRSLGLPTSLKKGIVTLIQDHVVCKKGQILSPEQAKLLVCTY